MGATAAKKWGHDDTKREFKPLKWDGKMAGKERTYGTRADEVDPFFEGKREWSKVKDKILRDYIECYLKTITYRRRPIIIIDAFAGPGRFGDGSEGSPLIICSAIRKTRNRGSGIACLFSDSRAGHREELETCLKEYIHEGIAAKPLDEFTEALSRALEIGKGATLFFYLDPYGIKDLDFETMVQIYGRDTNQSTEVLINFNFRTFMRMSGNWSYNESGSDIAGKVKEAKVETVNGVMGGDYWVGIITDPKLDKVEREDIVVGHYAARVREYFKYTYSIPVKEIEDRGGSVPEDDLAKYHLIFGTRSARAVVYMNDVAINALEPYFNQYKEGLLFDMTPERFRICSLEEIKRAVTSIVEMRPMTRPEIFEAVIPEYFMQRRKKEYRAIIDELTFEEKRLFPDRRTMKQKTRLNDETVLSTKPLTKGEGE